MCGSRSVAPRPCSIPDTLPGLGRRSAGPAGPPNRTGPATEALLRYRSVGDEFCRMTGCGGCGRWRGTSEIPNEALTPGGDVGRRNASPFWNAWPCEVSDKGLSSSGLLRSRRSGRDAPGSISRTASLTVGAARGGCGNGSLDAWRRTRGARHSERAGRRRPRRGRSKWQLHACRNRSLPCRSWSSGTIRRPEKGCRSTALNGSCVGCSSGRQSPRRWLAAHANRVRCPEGSVWTLLSKGPALPANHPSPPNPSSSRETRSSHPRDSPTVTLIAGALGYDDAGFR